MILTWYIVTFLDASKAFDNVNHFTLFDKLLANGMPIYLIRIIAFWYQHQNMSVKWGNATSTTFTVTNGVKQGGILSPLLFNIYIDDLSLTLSKSNIGCRLGGRLINHIVYADDLCILSMSPGEMQILLDICEKYGSDHDIIYNSKKNLTMLFKPKKLKDLKSPPLYLCNNQLE